MVPISWMGFLISDYGIDTPGYKIQQCRCRCSRCYSCRFRFEKNNLKIGYSYDFNLSNLLASSIGAHEISFTLDIPSNVKKVTCLGLLIAHNFNSLIMEKERCFVVPHDFTDAAQNSFYRQ